MLLEYSKQYGHCNVPKKDWYQCIISISEYNTGVENIHKQKFLKLKILATTLIKNTMN